MFPKIVFRSALEEEGIVRFYAGGHHTNFWLETARPEYDDLFMTDVRDMMIGFFWVFEHVAENLTRWGGSYSAFKAQNFSILQSLRAHWPFIQKRVSTFAINVQKCVMIFESESYSGKIGCPK